MGIVGMAVNAINLEELVEEEFYPQTNGGISDSITQNWTEQALECYRLNCDCAHCSIAKGNYSFVCQMPKVLDILIKSLGHPDKRAKLELVK
ncbi:MAG: hypothetical protein PHC64_05890 [Candidatus Gastranaerophilales bacterium]|nr:hypothetical protein [Candidatus Gastranaerophilales bacterium]